MNSRCFAGRVAMAGLLLGCESEVSLGTPGAAGEGGASPAIENDLPIEGAGGGATQGVGGSGGAAPFDVFLPGSPATWEPASETPIFCDRHTATRVDEGSVLIVGSCWLGREELPRAALVYDIEARTFTPIGMAEPRALHVAVVLDDGRVAIAGDANHVEYFTAGGGFELGPALATVRREPGIVRLPSNRFWLIGGRDEDGAALATTEIVDGDSASSSTGPELLTPRVRPAVLRNGPCAAWVMGGEEMTLGATVAATTEAAACPACPFASGLDLPEGNWPVLAMGDYTTGILVTPTWAAGTTGMSVSEVVDHEQQIQLPAIGMTDTGRYVGVGGDIYAWGERFIEITLDESAKVVATRNELYSLGLPHEPTLTPVGGDSLLVVDGHAAILTLAPR